jgi:gamma-glutamyltranspeptidase / glutathione hydrolase
LARSQPEYNVSSIARQTPQTRSTIANTVYFEYASAFQHVEGYNNETTAFMQSIGANIAFVAPGSTTALALRRLGNGTFEAAGDPRQLNSAGYAI